MVSLQQQLQTLQGEVVRLRQENDLHMREKALLQGTIDELGNTMVELNTENNKLKNVLDKYDDRINTLENERFLLDQS